MADHDQNDGAAAGPKTDEAASVNSAEAVPPKSETLSKGAQADAPHDAHDAHGLAHTTPVSLLVGVLAVLMVLTVITVLVTRIDLGAQGNLIVAMVIATIKAALVVSFFMHLVWDKKLHLVLFLTSVLFLILFLSFSVADRGEYQTDIDAFQLSEPAQ